MGDVSIGNDSTRSSRACSVPENERAQEPRSSSSPPPSPSPSTTPSEPVRSAARQADARRVAQASAQTSAHTSRSWARAGALGGGTRASGDVSAASVRDVDSGARLERGDEGREVAAVQRRLHELGYDCGDVDGKYGAKTEAAVKRFQKATGLAEDGVVGRRTLPALQREPPATATTTTTATTVDGASDAGGVAGSDASRQALAHAVNEGYQYLIGNDFPDATAKLKAAGAKGLAIVDREGATKAGVEQLKKQGVVPYAYNNAFQTQPGEKMPPGVRAIGGDAQWGEVVPDFKDKRWQDKRIAEAVDAAKKGFGGVMLDNVPRAGESKEAADYIKRMVLEARAASGNESFGVILQNGEELAKAHPWLISEGYVAGLQKEDVSFRVSGAGTGTGVAVGADERAKIKRDFDELRRQFPHLVTIAVDYPANASQAEVAQQRARELGFNVSHVAVGDGELSRISKRTRTVHPAAE